MAVLAANQNGNFLTSTTWSLIDQSSTTGNSYINSEAGTDTVTTAYSGTVSQVFSWSSGAPTIDGIGVRINERLGTTGTFSVHLEVATVEVTGTAVTIDCDDLPAITNALVNGGWIFMKFAAPVALSNSTSYSVAMKTTSASQISVYRDGTTDNVSRYLRTTTTQALGAGDDFIITGDYTAANTSAAITVTMDALASAITDYGSGSTTTTTPSFMICPLGSLVYGTTAATNYYLRLSGTLVIYASGTLSMGTTGTPMPRDSTGILNFDCASNVDFGLTVRSLGTFNAQGLSRTSGKNIYYCKLNTDEAANSTSLGVDTDTGWLDNDEIAVASTTRTNTECEQGTLNGNAGASSLTVDGFAGTGGGVAFAHSGTSPTQAEVILLTRNVRVFGASATLQAYIDIRATAVVDIDWTEFKWLGSATALKRGINCATTTGSNSIQYSSLHNFEVASSIAYGQTASTSTGWVFSNNVTFLCANVNFNIAATTGTWTVDSNIFMRNTDASTSLVVLSDLGGVFTNNTTVGGTSHGVALSDSSTSIGTFSGFTSHSCAGDGLTGSTAVSGTLSNLAIWRNTGQGIDTGSAVNYYNDVTINGAEIFGNGTTNIAAPVISKLIMINVNCNGDSTFSTTNGLSITAPIIVKMYNCNFGTASGIKTAHTNDIILSSSPSPFMVLNNCILASSTEVSNQANMTNDWSFISSQKHDQTAGSHKTWKKYGTITVDTSISNSASPSERLTPNNASSKLESGTRQMAVANGTALTPSVYVRESVVGDGTDYNGNRIRLVLKRNDAIGITSDTVIDTATVASEGAFEQLTGTTATATDDGVMEFYVDCDGTTGWINNDDWTVT